MHGRMKLRGSACGLGSQDTGSLLQAPRRLLGRVVAPAVVVAFPVGRFREVGELLGEGALAHLLAAGAEPPAAAGGLYVAVGAEALQVRAEGRGWDRQKARKLVRAGCLGEALRAHPVHRLEHLVADAKRLELAHGPAPFAPSRTSRPVNSPIAATAGASGSRSS